MTFEEILPYIKDGWTVVEKASGKKVYLLRLEWYSQLKRPFLCVDGDDDAILPWYPTSDEILSGEWEALEFRS